MVHKVLLVLLVVQLDRKAILVQVVLLELLVLLELQVPKVLPVQPQLLVLLAPAELRDKLVQLALREHLVLSVMSVLLALSELLVHKV
jgi:hypothetical protein